MQQSLSSDGHDITYNVTPDPYDEYDDTPVHDGFVWDNKLQNWVPEPEFDVNVAYEKVLDAMSNATVGDGDVETVIDLWEEIRTKVREGYSPPTGWSVEQVNRLYPTL